MAFVYNYTRKLGDNLNRPALVNWLDNRMAGKDWNVRIYEVISKSDF